MVLNVINSNTFSYIVIEFKPALSVIFSVCVCMYVYIYIYIYIYILFLFFFVPLICPSVLI